MTTETASPFNQFQLDHLYGMFLRVVSFFFLAFAIRHWLIVIGFPDSSVRFDTMGTHWQIAVAALSIVQPVAALGLWSRTRWGVTVWLMAAAIEFAMYLLFSDTYGTFRSLLMFHSACVAVFIAYHLTVFLRARRTEE